ncbi:MAG: AIPR family protein [Planctomycetota bacterium]|jgi:hypothetical protein
MSSNAARAIPLQDGSFTFTIQTDEYRSHPIPGVEGPAKIGDCFVRVTDLPERLDDFMKVNPRVPKRSQKGVLSGPVIKGILSTLFDNPQDMVLKNQGIYLLIDHAEFDRAKGGLGKLTITLSDSARHGIVNGGHTYAAIRDAVEQSEETDGASLDSAFVRLHLLQGIEESKVPEIAEGLNRSKQVDDPSLLNLRQHFQRIKDVMEGKPGEEAISYHQGSDGDVYISEVLVYLELFNIDRYNENKHPVGLYRSQARALKFFEADLKGKPSPADLLIPRLPEILALGDSIRAETPEAAKRIGFEFGRMKLGSGKVRAASEKHRNTRLPFISSTVNHRVPNGWLLPMLAAFRANVDWDRSASRFEWFMALDEVLPGVIDDLVRVCVGEHRDNNMRPEWVGKREAAYRQCYDKVLLFLARRGMLAQTQEATAK